MRGWHKMKIFEYLKSICKFQDVYPFNTYCCLKMVRHTLKTLPDLLQNF